jgi:hypothetical protein
MADGDVHVVKKGLDWTVTIEGIKGDVILDDDPCSTEHAKV